MKAAVVEKPSVLTVKDIPEPPVGDYEVFVEILYGAICSGTDQHLVDRTFSEPGFTPVPLPMVLGHESVGRVISVGPKVRHLKQGDVLTRVGTVPVGEYNVCVGGFAEKGIAKDYRAMQEDGLPEKVWKEAWINQVVPKDISPAAATMMTTWRETLSYSTRMGFTEGVTVLVIGSGGNGLAFVAHAANLGAANVTVIGAADREEATRRIGATHYVDYKGGYVEAQTSAIMEDGFDFIIDAVGKKGVADQGLTFIKEGGTLGIYGLDDYPELTIDPFGPDKTFTVYNSGYDEGETHEEIVAFIRAGKLDASIWINIENPYPLENINDAFDAIRARDTIKALVKISK